MKLSKSISHLHAQGDTKGYFIPQEQGVPWKMGTPASPEMRWYLGNMAPFFSQARWYIGDTFLSMGRSNKYELGSRSPFYH